MCCVKVVSLCTPRSRMGTGGIIRLFLNFDTRYRWMVNCVTSLSRSIFFYVLLHVVSLVSCLLCVLVITLLHVVCSGNTFFSVITRLRVGPLCNLSITVRGGRCLSSPYRLYWLWVPVLFSRHRRFLLGSKRPGSEPDNSAFVF
jgi:hypothetical protein